jgi:hypothetical protein
MYISSAATDVVLIHKIIISVMILWYISIEKWTCDKKSRGRASTYMRGREQSKV